MKKIYKYIGLLFGLLYSSISYSQNQVPDPGFENGCTISGWSSDMQFYAPVNPTPGYSNTCTDTEKDTYWPIRSYSGPGLFSIGANGNEYGAAWNGTPHNGSNYYFIGDGPWENGPGQPYPSGTCGSGIWWRRAWYWPSATIYQGNLYAFSAWYRYENTSAQGLLQLGITPSAEGNTANSNSNTSSNQTWNQMDITYLAPGSSTNPTNVEPYIFTYNGNTNGCDSDVDYWDGNDFGLDDICFGTPCDTNNNPLPIYYQNTNNLPTITYGLSIEAGYYLADNPYGASTTVGNVEVQASQNVTFVGGDYVELQSGFVTDNGAVFVAEIGTITGQCCTIQPCTNCLTRVGIPPTSGNNSSSSNTVAATEVQLTIYPNPTTGIVNIDFSNAQSEQVIVQVLDVVGKEVYTQSLGAIQKGQTTVDLSTEPSGVYIVKATSGSSVTTQKLVLAK